MEYREEEELCVGWGGVGAALRTLWAGLLQFLAQGLLVQMRDKQGLWTFSSGENKSHYVTEASLKPMILLPKTPSAGIGDVCYHIWLKSKPFFSQFLEASLMLEKCSTVELHP
jgi:hypothetical protein